MTSRHAYVCECLGPCSERVRITPKTYAELAVRGNVVSPWCTSPRERRVRFVTEDAIVTRRRDWSFA